MSNDFLQPQLLAIMMMIMMMMTTIRIKQKDGKQEKKKAVSHLYSRSSPKY